MNAVVLVALLSASCLGHNWLLTPPSRDGNVDSTSVPCDQPGANGAPAPTQVTVGSSLSATWTTNHNDDHFVYLVPSALIGQIETNKSVAVWSGEFPVHTGGTSVPIAATLRPGAYILQYVWDTWRNCADLQVLGAQPQGSTAVAGSPNTYALAGSTGTYNTVSGAITCTTGYVAAGSICIPTGATASSTSGVYALSGGVGMFTASTGAISCNSGCSVSGTTCACGAAATAAAGSASGGITPGGKAGVAFAVLLMVGVVGGLIFYVVRRKPDGAVKLQDDGAQTYVPPRDPNTV